MTDQESAVVMDSPVGPLLLAATGDRLTRVCLLETEPGAAHVPDRSPAESILAEAQRQLAEYFNSRRQTFDLPLAPRGTVFRQAVWRALKDIPFGETISYGELARRIDRPEAVRAVGAANGANPLPIIVPCHRVIGADRRLTGYAGGLSTKEALLRLEGRRVQGGRLV